MPCISWFMNEMLTCAIMSQQHYLSLGLSCSCISTLSKALLRNPHRSRHSSLSGWSEDAVPDVASHVCWFGAPLLGSRQGWGRGGALAGWPGAGPGTRLRGRGMGRHLSWRWGRWGRCALPRSRVASLSLILRAEGGAVWLVCVRKQSNIMVN